MVRSPRPSVAPMVRAALCINGPGSSGCAGRSSPGRSGSSTSETSARRSSKSIRCSVNSTSTRPVRWLTLARTPGRRSRCSTTRFARCGSRSKPRTAIRARTVFPCFSRIAGGRAFSSSGFTCPSDTAVVVSASRVRTTSRICCSSMTVGSNWMRILPVRLLACTLCTPGTWRSLVSI